MTRYLVRTRVYVAGPISLGNVKKNVERGIKTGEALARHGYAAIVPHYGVLWTPNKLAGTKEYEACLERDFSLISVCHAVLRLSGTSKGSDREVAWARLVGVPVYYTLSRLLKVLSREQILEIK